MTAITGALCAGRAPLFEATDTASHADPAQHVDRLWTIACDGVIRPREWWKHNETGPRTWRSATRSLAAPLSKQKGGLV